MRHASRHHTPRAGVSMVEMAIVTPILVLLLFGILEMGLLIKDYLGISQAAREGVRTAAVGSTLATIDARIKSSAPTIDTTQLIWQGFWRNYNESSGTWDATWSPLQDTGTGADVRNDAPPGAQVKISVTYPHQLLTGAIFAHLADPTNPGVMTVRANLVMRRE
jgi:Flp pilus assembly protein TadG